MLVVRGCGGVGGPVLEENVPSAGPEGLVGFVHELGKGNVGSGSSQGVQDEKEACEAFLQGQGEVR